MSEKEKAEKKAERLNDEIIAAIFETRDTQATILGKLNSLYEAFPGGDVDGHRRYHQLLIDNQQEMRKLVLAIKEKFLVALLWSLCVFLVVAAWEYIKVKLGLKPIS